MSLVVCGIFEQPIEEKNVTNSNVVVKQFCQWAAFLSKCGHPSRLSWPDSFSEVRVQVAVTVGVDVGVSVQLSDDVAE